MPRPSNIIPPDGPRAPFGGAAPGWRNWQTRYILQKIERALKEAGASFRNVLRTRIYVTQIDIWEQVAAVHREVFGHVRPATTLLEVSSLVLPEMALEIEMEAILDKGEA